jgi:predicted metal-dependent hydrolase
MQTVRGLVQLAFDFVEDRAAHLTLNGQVKSPVSAVFTSLFATEKNSQIEPLNPIGTVSPERLSAVLPPAHYRHPAATRQVTLGQTVVAYAFRRAKRRSIGFSVSVDGLKVSAPSWVPLYEVDAALREKSSWILGKLADTRVRHQRMAQAQVDWRDGAVFPYLGDSVTLLLDPTHTFVGVGAELRRGTVQSPQSLDGPQQLVVGLPSHADATQIRDAAQAWLMRQAKALFTERLNHFAPLLGVQWRKLSLSSAGTRWGSASVDGSIRLNWRLVHFKPSVIDYVVAHELSHLRVMDHSPRFWDTVATVMPDYAVMRRELKTETIPTW